MGIREYLEGQGVTVPHGSGWRPIKCPYHSDRTASASVNTTTGKFHCFACDIHEDVIGLIQRDTGVGYVEARQKAESEYGEGGEGVSGQSEPGDSLFVGSRDKRGNRVQVSTRRSAGWRERL